MTVSWVPLSAAPSPVVTTYGTTPPASPNDGDIWMFPADTTNGVMWQFRYRAASASAYKWEFVGGSPWKGFTTVAEVFTNTGYAEAANAPQRFTIPRAGEYFCHSSLTASFSTTMSLWNEIWLNATPGSGTISTSTGGWQTSSTDVFVTAAVNDVVNMRFRVSGGSAGILPRMLTVVPVRVS